MLKRFALIFILALLSITATAQVTSSTAYRLRKGSGLPSTCSPGDVFYLTGGASAYLCAPANTWNAIVGGAGGTPGGSSKQVQVNNGAGAFLGAGGFEYQSSGSPMVL